MGKAKPDYEPGQRLDCEKGSYKVLKVLGSGGMGDVYLVEDRDLGKKKVMKTLKGSLAHREDLRIRFEREARAAAQLSHPNIVEITHIDWTREGRVPLYLMERLTGNTLREVLVKRGALDLDAALGTIIDVLDALDHAHERGVVHRDIKPENIFLHKEKTGLVHAKVLDFGVMKLMSAEVERLTKEKTFIGTDLYAAAEQLLGLESVGPKVDIYAAAVVLFELLTGEHPLRRYASHKERIHAVIKLELPRLPDTFPPALVDVLAKAMSRDANVRPDAFHFAAELRRVKNQALRRAGTANPHTADTAEELADGHVSSNHPVSMADVSPATVPEAVPLSFARTEPAGPAAMAQRAQATPVESPPQSPPSAQPRIVRGIPRGGTDVAAAPAMTGPVPVATPPQPTESARRAAATREPVPRAMTPAITNERPPTSERVVYVAPPPEPPPATPLPVHPPASPPAAPPPVVDWVRRPRDPSLDATVEEPPREFRSDPLEDDGQRIATGGAWARSGPGTPRGGFPGWLDKRLRRSQWGRMFRYKRREFFATFGPRIAAGAVVFGLALTAAVVGIGALSKRAEDPVVAAPVAPVVPAVTAPAPSGAVPTGAEVAPPVSAAASVAVDATAAAPAPATAAAAASTPRRADASALVVRSAPAPPKPAASTIRRRIDVPSGL